MQDLRGGFPSNLLELSICQLQPQEPLQLPLRIPHGIVGAVYKTLSAVVVDIFLCHALIHKHKGAGDIEKSVGVFKLLTGSFVHGVATKVGSNDLQLGKQLQHLPQPPGMGVIIPLVTHMKQHRQPSL